MRFSALIHSSCIFSLLPVVPNLTASAIMFRPTVFLEMIQRLGCMEKDERGEEYQTGGCGRLGKGNFSELFKSIEDYEKSLEAKQSAAVQGS